MKINLMLSMQMWKHSAIHTFQAWWVLGLRKEMGLDPSFLKRSKQTFLF